MLLLLLLLLAHCLNPSPHSQMHHFVMDPK
jgi:hypothetical protein